MKNKKNKNPQKITEQDALDLCAMMAQSSNGMGHVPLFMVSGKEIGGGFRDYAVHGLQDPEYVLYVLKRLIYLFEGNSKKDVESN